MTTVIGVDLGTHKIAVSIWKEGALDAVWAFDSDSPNRGEQLRECAEYLYEWCAEALEDQTSAVYVLIEEPLIGNNRKYSMQISQVYGACLAEISGLEGLSGVYPAPVSTWKKQVTGSGRADKETIRNTLNGVDETYSVMCGGDQDKFDAACIGLYGVQLVARSEAMALPG